MATNSDISRSVSGLLPAYDLGVAPYAEVQILQAELRRSVAADTHSGALLLLEHEPVISLGAHAPATDVLDPARVERLGVAVARSERGGQSTVHAPGQLVAYPIVRIPGRDLRAFVQSLEEVLILVLAGVGLEGRRSPGRPGLYLDGLKVASVGLKCEHGVASHGSALNVNVDLTLFDLVVSCGEPALQQTSVERATGRTHPMEDMKKRYIEAFEMVFGVAVSRHVSLASTAARQLSTLDSPGDRPPSTRAMPTAGFEPAAPGSGGQCSIP